MSKKYTSNFELEKIPDETFIKLLRIELGKANSYIAELEDLLKKGIMNLNPWMYKNISRNLKMPLIV